MKINGEKILSKTISILIEIGKIIDEGVDLIGYEGLKRRAYYIEGDPRRLSTNIKRLEHSGYIEIDRKSNSVQITNKGKIKLLENSTNNKIDGKWRLLSFDIPETLRKKRNQFRRSIKRIGYKQVQKSLWASPFVQAEEVDLIVKELNVEKFVAYIVTDKIDIEKHLKRLFSLELKIAS